MSVEVIHNLLTVLERRGAEFADRQDYSQIDPEAASWKRQSLTSAWVTGALQEIISENIPDRDIIRIMKRHDK